MLFGGLYIFRKGGGGFLFFRVKWRILGRVFSSFYGDIGDVM